MRCLIKDMRKFLIALLLLSFSYSTAQERVTTAGFQFKPIFKSDFFTSKAKTVVKDELSYTVQHGTGNSFGMVVRRGLSERFSFETGINLTKRNFEFSLSDSIGKHDGTFAFMAYEIPAQLLVFIQLSEAVYMDVSFGGSISFYPSDIIFNGDNFQNFGLGRNWNSLNLIANLGFEYRTQKNGYFYIGSSYHRPTKFILGNLVEYKMNQTISSLQTELLGNYLTLDFRYFFPGTLDSKKTKK